MNNQTRICADINADERRKKMSKFKIIFGFLIAILIFAFLFLLLSPVAKTKAGPLDEFAGCLTDNRAAMYGADWCPHCQTQKKLFGRSFRHINYVECPRDPKRCLAAGIEGYPTWIMPSGERMIGEQKLEDLSRASGCFLPTNF